MLQFPFWKVALILLVLFTGGLFAMPNLFSDPQLGIEPRKPVAASAEQLAKYEADVAAARASTWPAFLPKTKMNLGLDLQGGVYLKMEIDPAEVVAGRLEVFAGDVETTLIDRSNGKQAVRHEQAVTGDSLSIRLRDPTQMQEALARIRKLNGPVTGSISGEQMYSVAQSGEQVIEVRATQASRDKLVEEALAKSMTIVRRRVDPDGVTEVSLTPEPPNRIVLEAPGEASPDRIKSLLSRDGRMTFNMADITPSKIEAARRGAVPPGYRLLPGRDLGDMLVKTIPEIVGSEIETASSGISEENPNYYQINFRLNGSGTTKFWETTRRNSGQYFAIVLDDVVMSAPRINEPIPGGNVRITGDFQRDEAADLAAIIEAGEIPAKLQFIEERTVGPSLGQDSIDKGTLSSIVGFALVALFMLLAYNLMGAYAVIALSANLVLLIGALSIFGGTLTLPGIAGIALTLGMAVDANVLVYERIREEQREGRSVFNAVQAGYERAFLTILDANLTTLLAAITLYFLGSGPVRGFALTLGIGLVTSVFTAFVVTRWMTVMWLKAFRPKQIMI